LRWFLCSAAQLGSSHQQFVPSVSLSLYLS
jgi:hypothetical protein